MRKVRKGPAAVGVCLALAVLVAGVPAVASADTETAKDPREFGEEWRFDIETTTHGHGRPRPDRPARLKHAVEFYEPFKARHFKNASLWLKFPGKDRRIYVRFRKGEYRGQMWSTKGFIGRPKVWKSSRDTISLSFPRRWLKRDLKRYRWQAYAEWYPPCDDTPEPQPGGATPASSCPQSPTDAGREMTHRV